MATAGHQYTLVGFSEEVDRRPLFFVEPLPVTRICSACGLVPSGIAFLPCEHFVCKSCYHQCVRSGRVACPLDGDTCSDEEVSWINHPARSILGKQVSCWNHTSGCNVVTAAADISKHFHHECEHHMGRCPKCSAKILASDVCAHIESHCDALKIPSVAAIQARKTVSEDEEPHNMTCPDITTRNRRTPNANSADLSSIQAQLKEISQAFKIAIAPTLAEDGHTNERQSRQSLLQQTLSRIQNQMAERAYQRGDLEHEGDENQEALSYSLAAKFEALEHTVKQVMQTRIDQSKLVEKFSAFSEALEVVHCKTKAEFDKISRAIDCKFDRITDRFRNTFAPPLSILPIATTHTWTFTEFSKGKGGAFVAKMSEKVYLRGYYVSAGIVMTPDGFNTLLFQLHRGKLDEFLQWPFNLPINFSVVYQGCRVYNDCCNPPDIYDHEHFLRPVNKSNDPIEVPVCGECLFVERYNGGSRLEDCTIVVRVELSPKDDA